MNEEITKLLVQDRAFSREANEIFARSIERMASCQRLIGENAFVVEEKATGKIIDIGKISCGSRLCENCAKKREAREENKLKLTIKKWKEQNPKGRLLLLTIGFPPLTHKMTSFYEKKSVDLYLKEAKIKREIVQKFLENLTRTSNFICGYFKNEELTVKAERFIKKRLAEGNSLNLHCHILLFLNENHPQYTDYEFSLWFYKKVFRAYLEKCKKYSLKPSLMKVPYVEKGTLKGAVVVESERAGAEGLEKYLTKSHWGLEKELTSASKKSSKGLTLTSLLASKRNENFKQNFAKFICLFLYNHRTFQFSKPRNHAKEVGVVKKSPLKSVRDIVKKFIRDQSKLEGNYQSLETVTFDKKKKREKPKIQKNENIVVKEYTPIAMVDAFALMTGEMLDYTEEMLTKKWEDHKILMTQKKNEAKRKKPKIMLESVIRG